MIDHADFPTEAWTVRETGLDLDVLPQTESVFALANGHLGLRGNLDEGEPRGLSGTYLNGLYESYPLRFGERGYGFPVDGQAVVNVSDGKLIRLLIEDEPFDVRHGHLARHERELDLRSGILSREAEWGGSLEGNAVRVRSRRLVSFVDRSVAAISYEVEALERPLRVAIQSNLVANQVDRPGGADPRAGSALEDVLVGRLAVDHGLRVCLGHTTRRTGIAVAAGMEHLVDAPGEVATLSESEPDLGRVTLSVELEPGAPLRLTKLLSYHWSSAQSVQWLRDQVDASLQSALAQGFDGLAERQRAYLDDYWSRADVEVDGDPELQQALRFASFHLLQSARGEGRSIAAKGLTGPGYDGHAFWDTEAFVLPVLTHTVPAAAREALRWRHSTLPEARRRADELGMGGAALPWRTIHGEECSGYWPAGTAALHVNAAVAAAVERYVTVTGDEGFLDEAGLELLAESARLWVNVGHRDADGGFHIHGVTGPDEYSAIVDDNTYTNLMAARNLAAAADAAERRPRAAERLGVAPGEAAAWRAAAEAIHVPFDEQRGIPSQDADFFTHERWDFDATPADRYPLLLNFPYFQLYRRQVVKQADLALALYLCGDRFSAEERRRAFDHYEGLTVRDSSLSASTQAIVAADVGHLELAFDYLVEAAFMDIRDLEHNARDGVHMASLAGALLAAVAGIGGLRVGRDRLSFRPRLPEPLDRLAFTVPWREAAVRVEIGAAEASYSLSAGESTAIEHWGEELTLVPGAAVARPIPPAPALDPPRQPPGREPAMRDRNRTLRETGVA